MYTLTVAGLKLCCLVNDFVMTVIGGNGKWKMCYVDSSNNCDYVLYVEERC